MKASDLTEAQEAVISVFTGACGSAIVAIGGAWLHWQLFNVADCPASDLNRFGLVMEPELCVTTPWGTYYSWWEVASSMPPSFSLGGVIILAFLTYVIFEVAVDHALREEAAAAKRGSTPHT